MSDGDEADAQPKLLVSAKTTKRSTSCPLLSVELMVNLIVVGSVEAKRVRPTLLPEDLPEHPAETFPNPFNRCRVADAYLQSALKETEPIVVDFDLMVVNFHLETSSMVPKPGDIPISSAKIIADYDLDGPFVGRQQALLDCALHIQQVVNHYYQHPSTPKPFALRVPNLKTLKSLTAERSKAPIRLSDTEAVVLVDLYHRLLAIGLPPKPKTKPTSKDKPNPSLSAEVS